jgi:hypothetical protein
MVHSCACPTRGVHVHVHDLWQARVRARLPALGCTTKEPSGSSRSLQFGKRDEGGGLQPATLVQVVHVRGLPCRAAASALSA